ncbi:MAG TPA: flagellar biosynthesis anti-sigma factor FlgM [Tepidiformaceae bacterium]
MSRTRKTPALDRPYSSGGSVAAPDRTESENAERIAKLRQQVREGTYVPDPYEIARRILDEGL